MSLAALHPDLQAFPLFSPQHQEFDRAPAIECQGDGNDRQTETAQGNVGRLFDCVADEPEEIIRDPIWSIAAMLWATVILFAGYSLIVLLLFAYSPA